MIRNYLPYFVQRELFGDRKRFGPIPDTSDPDWERWIAVIPDVYRDTQRTGSIAVRVNDSGYDVLNGISFTGKKIAELGPGGGYHLKKIMGRPAIYHAIDVQPDFFPPLREKALGLSIPIQCHTVTSNRPHIPLDSESQDFMMSFYSLEHLNPLHAWLDEIFRILKPNGILVGAIPAEGGIGWGLGRWLTSRRVLKRKYHLDMNKIICWEHVSFCDEILRELNRRGSLWKQNWPLPFFPNDFSLVVKFRVVKPFDS